jgi:type IVB pilus formation R64 PilN family outer membrane protein
MKLKLVAAALTAAFLSAGCASTITADANKSVENADREASKAIESIRAGKPIEPAAPAVGVRRVNGIWVPVSKVSEDDYRAAPVLNRDVVVNRNITNLQEASSYITLLTGVPVAVAAPPAGTGKPTGGAPVTTPAPGMASANGMQQLDMSGFISYSGKLSGFLDVLAARFGVYWEPDGDGVRFFYTKSRTFRLAALPGDSSMSSTIGTSSSGGGGGGSSGGSSSGGSSSSSSQLNSGIAFDKMSVWKAVEDGIKTMLTPYGRVVVTPATGTITVDDTPPSLERVEKYVHEQNAALTRQVVMNVRVLSVELTDSDSYGINWDAIYQNIGRGLGATLSSASGLPGGSSVISFNVINTNSMWDGTKAILEALSKQGRVSQITSASIVTINNQPAPIQVGRQRSYLASSTTTLGTAGSGNTTTLVPGVVTTGFSMSVLPHILDNGRMMLQYAGDVSSLLNIDTVSSNGSTIQTPEIDTRNFLQRVMMRNGETLVLTGFEQLETSGGKQGIGSPENLALGGSAKSSKNKTVLVVLIQPVMTAGEQ